MSKSLFLEGSEKILTFTLVIFILLSYLFINDNAALPEIVNHTEVAIYSLDEAYSFYIQRLNPAVAIHFPVNKKTRFTQAIGFTLKHEGGLVNDKSDSGGMTKYGISYAYLRNLLLQQPQYLSKFSLKNVNQINPTIIKRLTLRQALAIYYRQWWLKHNFSAIQNQAIATKAFDYSVNMGSSPAIKLLQIACIKQNSFLSINPTGKLDRATISYINSLDSIKVTQLLYVYEKVASNHYLDIAKRHPKYKKFLVGWLHRANDNTELVS